MSTAWKVSKYRVFSGPNVGKYGPKQIPYLDTFHAESSYEYRHTCSFAHMSYYLLLDDNVDEEWE